MSCALRFSAVCDDARTSPDGKLDLHGVYHDLSAPGFPAKQDHLVRVLVIEWPDKDQGRFQCKADLEDSQCNISLTVEGESEVRAAPEGHPPPRSQLVMPMDGVIFPKPGQYLFRVKVKGETFQGPGIYLRDVPEEQSAQPEQ